MHVHMTFLIRVKKVIKITHFEVFILKISNLYFDNFKK